MITRHYIHPTYGYHVFRLGRSYFRVGWRGKGEWNIMPWRTSTAIGCALWAFGWFLQVDWNLL